MRGSTRACATRRCAPRAGFRECTRAMNRKTAQRWRSCAVRTQAAPRPGAGARASVTAGIVGLGTAGQVPKRRNAHVTRARRGKRAQSANGIDVFRCARTSPRSIRADVLWGDPGPTSTNIRAAPMAQAMVRGAASAATLRDQPSPSSSPSSSLAFVWGFACSVVGGRNRAASKTLARNSTRSNSNSSTRSNFNSRRHQAMGSSQESSWARCPSSKGSCRQGSS